MDVETVPLCLWPELLDGPDDERLSEVEPVACEPDGRRGDEADTPLFVLEEYRVKTGRPLLTPELPATPPAEVVLLRPKMFARR